MSASHETVEYEARALPAPPRKHYPFSWRIIVALVALPLVAVTVGLISARFTVTPEVMANRGKPIVAPTAGEGTDGNTIATAGASASADANEEHAKIERLLQAVAKADAKFIRNGEEHSPADAATHLRRKYDAAKKDIKTARDFIDNVASKSKMSGDPYKIKLPDGKEMLLKEWLDARLAEIESPSGK